MVTRKGLVVGLLAVAVLLSVFSLTMSFSVDSLNPKGQSESSDLGGNVNLLILSPDNTSVAESNEDGG